MSSRTAPDVPQHKRTYEKPTLTKYGQLKDLTAGGSGQNTENQPQQQNKKP